MELRVHLTCFDKITLKIGYKTDCSVVHSFKKFEHEFECWFKCITQFLSTLNKRKLENIKYL